MWGKSCRSHRERDRNPRMNKDVILEIAKKAKLEEKDREKIVLFAELLKDKIFQELQKYLRVK
jgi:biotin synthase-like enzyme